MQEIQICDKTLRCSHTAAETLALDGEKVLRVVKTDKQDIFDEDTYVLIPEVLLSDGTVEVKVRSRLLPDAPDFARGFIGIVFRVNGPEFESFYVRPTNGRHPDPVRRSHGCQYFSYPGYTFAYFREHGIEGYEAPADIGLDEWITVRAVIKDDTARFFVNDAEVLVVPKLKHGKSAGGIGFYVDTGTEGFFKDLMIEPSSDQ